jgi:hypothetical protein
MLNAVFHSFKDSIEAGRVRYGDFAQHLSVKLNISFFTAVDELAVSYSPLSTGGAQPGNPQSSEFPFSPSAVGAGVDSRPYSSLFGQAIQMTRSSMMAFDPLENSFS